MGDQEPKLFCNIISHFKSVLNLVLNQVSAMAKPDLLLHEEGCKGFQLHECIWRPHYTTNRKKNKIKYAGHRMRNLTQTKFIYLVTDPCRFSNFNATSQTTAWKKKDVGLEKKEDYSLPKRHTLTPSKPAGIYSIESRITLLRC